MVEKYKLYYRIFIVIFWVTMCYGFVSEELIPPLQAFDTVELLIVDAVFVFLGLITIRNRGDVMVAIVFFLLVIFSNLFINHIGVFYLLNGTRDFISILFGVPIIRWFMTGDNSGRFIKSMDKQLRIWLYIQAFCLTWQLLRYGANDAGGGSFGYGSSGMVSTLIYLISFYLLSKHYDPNNSLKSLRENKEYLLLLIPTFFNETKISFVFLLIYILMLFRYDRTIIWRMFIIVPVMLVAMSLSFMIYIDLTGQDEEDLLTWEFFQHYLVSGGEDLDHEVDMALQYQDGVFDDALEVEWWTLDLPRYAKVILIGPVMLEHKGGLIAGAGVGTLKSGRATEQTPFAKEYDWLLKGTRIWLLFLFVSLGIPGIIWWIWAFCRVAYHGQLYGRNAKKVLIYLSLVILLIVLYSDFIRQIAPMLVILYILFSIRHNGLSDNKSVAEVNPCPEPGV